MYASDRFILLPLTLQAENLNKLNTVSAKINEDRFTDLLVSFHPCSVYIRSFSSSLEFVIYPDAKLTLTFIDFVGVELPITVFLMGPTSCDLAELCGRVSSVVSMKLFHFQPCLSW